LGHGTRPWRLAAFDVAIRNPLPSSLHLSVLWLLSIHSVAPALPFMLHTAQPNPALYAGLPNSPPTPSQSASPLPVPPDHPFQSSILPSTFDSTCHIMRWHCPSSTPRQPCNARSPGQFTVSCRLASVTARDGLP
jgi:hypothetical protein